MDIIKKIFNLNSGDILNKINNIISESEKMLERIIKDNMLPDKDKVKLLIEDTFLFDTYYGIINIKILLAESNGDLKNLLMSETKLKNYNTNFNKFIIHIIIIWIIQ